MSENRKSPGLQHIPRKSEMVPVSTGGGAVNVRGFIARALEDDEVIARMEPYKINGGKCGSARLDDVRTMDIVIAYDDEHGGTIKRLLDEKVIMEAEVLRQVNVEMRSRYAMDKHHKIIGLNPKHYRLLGN
jgi:hypothetical protein